MKLVRSVLTSLFSYGFPNFHKGKVDLTVGYPGNRNTTPSNTRISEGWNVGLLYPLRCPSSWESVLALCVLSVSCSSQDTSSKHLLWCKSPVPSWEGVGSLTPKIYFLWFLELV